MKQNIAIKLSNPINCQLWHHSYIQLKEISQKIVSHHYLIFRNQLDIKHFLFLLTFSYHWEILYEPPCQLCWVNFTHAGHVILQLILYKLWSKTLLQAFQPHKLANYDITVASSSKTYPKNSCHTLTLSLEISKILNIFYFY